MPRVGSKQSIVWTPPATHRAIVTFCWLPPDSRRTSPPARASICSVATASSTVLRSRRRSMRPQSPRRVDVRQRDVLADGALHQQGLGAIRRDVDETRPDRVGRVAERDGRCRRPAARRRSAARSRPGCRTARPGPGPRARPPRAPRPGSRSNETSRSFDRALKARAAAAAWRPRRARPADVRAATAGISSAISAEHELDDPLLGALGHVDDADGLALAQDGRPVAHGRDLDHAMRDEDDRAVAARAGGRSPRGPAR